MRKRFRRLGLIYKITIMIVCILIVPTFLIGLFYYQSYKQSLYENADKKLEESIYAIKKTMQTSLDDADNALGDIEYSQELIYFLDKKSVPSEGEISRFLESIQEEWINLRQIYPNLFSQMILYSSNEMIEMDNSWKLYMYALDDFYEQKKADEQQGYWYGMIHSLEGDSIKENPNIVNTADNVLPVYMNIRNVSTDEIIGIVELDVPFEKIIDSRKLYSEEAEIEYLFLDNEGRAIYQTEGIGEISQGVSQGERTDTVRNVVVNGKRYRILETENTDTGITSMAMIEEKLIVRPARRMVYKVGIAAFLGIIIIMLFTFEVIKRMLNRLVVMDAAMEQVETGDFQVHLEDDGYDDEVSRMKRRFKQMADRLQTAIDEVIEREKAQNEAELRALQAQINPHFLFNTLETMRMQCEIDCYYKVGNGLMALGEMFRYTLRWSGHEVPFYLEWNNLKNYISLMALRLDDDFSFELECEEGLNDKTVPKMFLQPIVENSFQHGFKGVPAPWHLEVRALLEGGSLVIHIQDNGCGVPENRLMELQEAMRQRKSMKKQEDSRQSIGIINVVQRIDRICRTGSGIEIKNREGGGIDIKIKIVLEEA